MTGTFFWDGTPIPFDTDQTVAMALSNAGISMFGYTPTGVTASVFCGIGQCQNCLVKIGDTSLTEACLLLCYDGLRVSPQNSPAPSSEVSND